MTELEKLRRARTRLMQERVLIKSQRKALRNDIKKSVIIKEIKAGVKTDIKVRGGLPKKLVITKSKWGYYTEADGQLRGKKDLPHLIKTYDAITSDIISKGYTNVVLMLLGDHVEGSHRASSKVTDDAIPQAIQHAKATNDFLLKLSKIAKVYVYMVTADNHGEVRSLGGPGETPQNNVLNIIKEMVELSAKGNPNLTVKASHVFYSTKLPGPNAPTVALYHGNYSVQKNLFKFKSLAKDATVLIQGHKHHNEWKQEIGFDFVIAPSSKKHIEDYEIGGGFAEIDVKTNTAFRQPQFQEIKFNKNQRVRSIEVIDI